MAAWAVTTAGAVLEFDITQGSYNSCCAIDSNHFINFWSGELTDGYTQVFTVDTSTWAVTTAAATLEFDTVLNQWNTSWQVDSNHFINFYTGDSSDGFVEIFTVNTSTWAVTTAAARLEFDTQTGTHNASCQIDTNHFINFWQGGAATTDSFAQVFTVNTTTWAVTTAAATLQYDTDVGTTRGCVQIDSNHFLLFWAGESSDGYTQVFTVNTTTWAVTTAAATLEFATQQATSITRKPIKLDDNHFLCTWSDFGAGVGLVGFAQVFTVDTTTWAVSTAAAPLEYITNVNSDFNSLNKIDTNHVLDVFVGGGGDGFAQTLIVNTSTWAVSTAAAELEFDTGDLNYSSIATIDSSHFIVFWEGVSADGFVQVLAVELPSSSNMKSYNTNLRTNIKSMNTNLIANVKSFDTNP